MTGRALNTFADRATRLNSLLSRRIGIGDVIVVSLTERMLDSIWDQTLRLELSRLHDANLKRERHIYEPIDATHVRDGHRVLVNFASNNYLGLTHHPALTAAINGLIHERGAGAGAAGLITGFTAAHAAAEHSLARWKQTERAVLLPSGYQANLAAIQTLAGIATASSRPLRFLVDKLAHASLWDAVRATGAAFRIFPHNHMPKLERLLRESDPRELQVVLTESIFSMDGDAADLQAIVRLKKRFPFLLLVDEAHATGVYGEDGNGLIAELGLSDQVDVSVVTLSKALGVAGGAVCASALFCDALVNFGRAYIFSTAIPPQIALAAEAAIQVVIQEPHRRQRLRALARRVREELSPRTEMAGELVESPIIPVVFGEAAAAMGAADRLREKGLLVIAVRPPTVPRGSSRLRITLCCEHTDDEVSQLIAAVRELRSVQAS